MTATPDTPRSALVELDQGACFDRLRQMSLGRVALSWDALPEIFPVQYALLGRDPVFRTMPDHQLMAAAHGQVLSLGIDEFDPEHQAGWRVLVTGPAARLTDPEELEAARGLPLRPWTSDGDGFVRISAALVRGTEFRDLAPGHGT